MLQNLDKRFGMRLGPADIKGGDNQVKILVNAEFGEDLVHCICPVCDNGSLVCGPQLFKQRFQTWLHFHIFDK